MELQSYIFFNGNCGEAIAFYREALDAHELFRMRFDEAPPDPNRPPTPSGFGDKIMHATLQIGQSQLMMSDGGACSTMKHEFNGFSLSVTAADVETAARYFDALSQGGQVRMPFQKTFWSPGFGMLTDRFGVPWMVTAPHELPKEG